MGNFAKIFDLGRRGYPEQILVVKEYDDNADEYKVVISTDLDGVRVSMAPSWQEEEPATELLKSFDLDKAYEWRVRFEEMFNGPE